MSEVYLEELPWEDFSVAENTLNWLKLEACQWLDDRFVEQFQEKYRMLSLSKLDGVSVLMYEASNTYGEEAIYDIFNAAIIQEALSFQSQIYLLEKAIAYCKSHVDPYQIYSDLKKRAGVSDEYRLLAECWHTLTYKYHVSYDEEIKNLLDMSRSLMKSDYERLMLALSYANHSYEEAAAEILTETLDAMVEKISKGEIDHQAVKSLMGLLLENSTAENSMTFEISNRLYGAFKNDKD